MIAQGLFGKLPRSDEHLLIGLPGWAVDLAWSIQDRLGPGAHRYAVADWRRKAVVYGASWPSRDALGRQSTCTMAAVERGRRGLPADPWRHPWFADAGVRQQTIVADEALEDLVGVATRWAMGMVLQPVSRERWPRENRYAWDDGRWTNAAPVVTREMHHG